MLKFYLKITLLLPLIGELKELLPQLKTKDNVDHVGLSQQLEVLKVLLELKEYPLSHLSQNNN
jgi:hypothetical protein